MSLDPDVTDEMLQAGREVSSLLIRAAVARNMNGLGGSETWEQFSAKPIPNRDLVMQYLHNGLSSVAAIYLAIDRARRAAK